MEIEKIEVNAKSESWEDFKKRNNIDYDWVIEKLESIYPKIIDETLSSVQPIDSELKSLFSESKAEKIIENIKDGAKSVKDYLEKKE